MAESGIPEYNIFVREIGKGEEDWVPSGSMAVPRGVQLWSAVMEQEESLKAGAFRMFPRLKDADLEYAYNLKVYPDEPPKLIEKKEVSENQAVRFFEGLLNPLNTSGQMKRGVGGKKERKQWE
ncbi:unnamed protein product [Chrysoparadoxa australica]